MHPKKSPMRAPAGGGKKESGLSRSGTRWLRGENVAPEMRINAGREKGARWEERYSELISKLAWEQERFVPHTRMRACTGISRMPSVLRSRRERARTCYCGLGVGWLLYTNHDCADTLGIFAVYWKHLDLKLKCYNSQHLFSAHLEKLGFNKVDGAKFDYFLDPP